MATLPIRTHQLLAITTPYDPQALPQYLNGSSGVGVEAGGLEETSGASSHNLNQSVAGGHGETVVNIMEPGAGPSVVVTGRENPDGLRRRRTEDDHNR